MNLAGRRIHIAGSVAQDAALDQVHYAHTLIDMLVRALANEGATFGCGVGKEPHLQDDAKLPTIHFDWTVIAAAAETRDAQRRAAPVSGRLISTVATSKTKDQIPPNRLFLWEELLSADEVDLTYAPTGWYSAAYRRRELAQRCDAVILLSGGEGVEHLANEYAAQGKPVLPLDLGLGGSTNDGSGGASTLSGRMRATPGDFAQMQDPDAAGGLLAHMETRHGATPVEEVVGAVQGFLHALMSPNAFFVRMLNPKVQHYHEVDDFFREVTGPLVEQQGFEKQVMGSTNNDEAWMDSQIFDWLANSRLIVVDLTDLRPSCLVELGFALRSTSTVLVTARQGTDQVFDTNAFEQYHWDPSTNNALRREEFQAYWNRNLRRPPIVLPRRIV